MSADRISRTGTIIFKSEEVENTPTGARTTITWHGSRTECASQKLVDQLNGASFTKLTSNEDGTYTLTSTWSYDLNGNRGGAPIDPPTNIHDLETTMDTISVYNSTKLYAELMAVLGGADVSVKKALSTVRAAVAQYHNGIQGGSVEIVGDTPQAQISAENLIANCFPDNADLHPLMVSLFHQVAIMGVETVPEFNNVYRRSITAATPTQVKVARTGEGMIWTSDEVSKFENLPAFWWFDLPAGLQWLKVPANVNLVAGGKTRIDYYYIGCKQASGLFNAAYNSAVLLP